jgi:ribosomal protein L19
MLPLTFLKYNLNNIEFFLLYQKKKTYFKYDNVFFFSKLRSGNIVFVEYFNYEFYGIRKYFFLGLCISYKKRGLNSAVTLRNALHGILVEKHFLVFNVLIIFLRISRKRIIDLRRSKLFFLKNLPYFFRLNKYALLETYYYSNKKSLKIQKKKKK